ncbi:TldD/PmbA family protein, partial [bacterium]|nr:TldD/PmbA family protein [bacterium]
MKKEKGAENADVARQALARAAPRGTEQLEIFTLEEEARTYEIADGRLENIKNHHAFGLAVRILDSGRVGFACRADTRPEAVDMAVTEARDILRHSAPDSARGFFPGPKINSEPPAYDLLSRPAEEKIAMAHRIATAAMHTDVRVKQVRQAAYYESSRRMALVNSLGLELSWGRPAFSLGALVLAENRHDTQMGEEYRSWRNWEGLDPEGVGMQAGYQAAGLLGAESLPTGRRTLLVPPGISASLLEAAWKAWSAESVQRSRSFLDGREGTQIAASGINLIDDGTLKDGLGTAMVDDEGSPMQRTELVKDGKLTGLMHNIETARRARISSTGNGLRLEFKTMPDVHPTNFWLLPGTQEVKDLKNQAEGGLYLAEVMGLHTLDAVTGEFSLGASGWVIEDGTLGRPVRGVTIAGRMEAL